MACRNEGQKPWAFRRKVVITALLFCAFCIGFVMVHGAADVPTGQTIVASAFGMATMLISTYIVGAVWDDKGKPA